MLNSRRAFRAQSQLVCAIRCAGKTYAQRYDGVEAIGAEAIPWDRLQSAYGRIMIDRLSPWLRKAGEQLLVYRHADLLEVDSGSHLYQFLIAAAETRALLCRIIIHIVRIGPRDDVKRPWGTITAHGQPTKPQDVSKFFSYPSIDFGIL